MFSVLKFAERFFPKVFVGIWLNGDNYLLTKKRVLPSGKIKNETFSFDKNSDKKKFFKLLSDIQLNNIVTYIAILDNSPFQGALPVANRDEYLWFPEISQYKEYDDLLFKKQSNWSLFTLKTELLHTQNNFKDVGLDFIFSPFILPIAVQKRFKLPASTSIFVLAEKDLTIFTIFKGDELLYGTYIKDIDYNDIIIEESKDEIDGHKFFKFDDLNSDIESDSKFKNQSDSTFFDDSLVGFEEEEIDFDDFDDFDKHKKDVDKSMEDELLDLDMFLDDEISYKPEKHQDLEKNDEKEEVVIATTSKRKDIAELSKFLDDDMDTMEEEQIEEKVIKNEINHDLVFQGIKRNVQIFYSDNTFHSDFIENCYILTSLKVNNSLIQNIEADFSFETEKIRVDFSELVVDLIGEELGKSKI